MMPFAQGEGWITAADYLMGLVYRARARDRPPSLTRYGKVSPYHTDILKDTFLGGIKR